jgi:ABC-type sugar transport system permease subunit
MFDQLYGQNRAGYASAIAILLSFIIFALTIIQFRYIGRRSEGE